MWKLRMQHHQQEEGPIYHVQASVMVDFESVVQWSRINHVLPIHTTCDFRQVQH